MAAVTRDKEMRVKKATLFGVIIDFERYPQFLPEVMSAQIKSGKGTNKVTVEFELEVIKRFQYLLEFHIEPQEKVSWRLKESNFFKENAGCWSLQECPQGTRAHYELSVGFGFLVPGWVTKKLTETSLPMMFALFEKRASEVEERGR